MALLGEPVTAARAADIGLINAAWPDEEFAERAGALLERLSNGPTRSYAGSKRELNHWLYARMPEHLALEAQIQGELGRSKDFIEGVSAFLEKRKPTFTGE
jgi:2-(1,2-epoxy-1,2-dihydrophenyl)acetyl-CoA isomerase